tara:strand:- start:2201 stop:3100 length:900 start_codon:yes stop_codon:yes gene_type:complete
MTFLNKKEDVVDIAVTPHGKYLISKGKFKPKFYAFFDDDVVYDGEYIDLSEDQNDIVGRIRESLSLRPIMITSGSLNDDGMPITSDSPVTRKANSMLSNPLGTSDLRSDFFPSWNIQTISDSVQITGSVEYSSPFSQRTDMAEIPQVHFDIEWVYYVPFVPEGTDGDTLAYNVQDQRVVLSIEEENVFDKVDGNYDIEVFLCEGPTDSDTSRTFKHKQDLKFITDDAFDEQTGVLMASTDNEIGGRYPRLDSSYVEYFLSIKADGELTDTLGENVIESTAARDLYSTRFGDDDSGEVCD